MKKGLALILLLAWIVLALSACRVVEESNGSADGANPQSVAAGQFPETNDARLEFTLQTGIINGRISYHGVGGDIDGLENPDLHVRPKAAVQITLINGDGMTHDLALPDFDVKSSLVSTKGQTAVVSFMVGEVQQGTFAYYCSQPGHRQAGQEGKLIVDRSE